MIKLETIKINEPEAHWLVDNGIWVGRTPIENQYKIAASQIEYVGQIRKWWRDKEDEKERKRNRK
jgi:hypothetical protein